MIILPQKYDELPLDRYDKQLIAMLKSIYKEDATFLLCCNPSKTVDGVVHVLITNRGVSFIHMKQEITSMADFIPSMFSSMTSIKDENKIISARFSSHRNLVKNGSIVFPFKTISFFPCLEKPDLTSFASVKDVMDYVNTRCLFKGFWKDLQKDKMALEQFLWGKDTQVSIYNEIIPDIINRIAPEYTIPRAKATIDNEVHEKRKGSIYDSDTTIHDRAAISYMLDEGQINYINKIKKGDQLIIACAGSGKSIILISKCFKLAALNPDKHFLITGYNRNLVSYFKWLIDAAGFSTNNVECLTFDKLCIKLLKDNGIRVPSVTNGDYSRIRSALLQNLYSGHIKNRYYGVFIDEVQMFEPEWYKACFDLVENKNNDEHFFVICGDKSQSVKTAIKSGKAPWQGHGERYPSFRGKSFPIEINYRNSIEINDYIQRFTDRSLKYAEMLNIPVNRDADIFLRGKSQRHGLSLDFIQIPQQYKDSEAEAITVLNQINDIHDTYQIPYDSIAVICYNRQYSYIKGRNEKHYRPIDHLKEYLIQSNIPYSLLNNTSDEYGVSYANIDGVPIVTMESSLGLDFQAVIICGLVPLGLHDKTKYIDQLKNTSDNEDTINAFNKNINILYMACARAKDVLRIVSAESEDESVYIKMLKESFVQED